MIVHLIPLLIHDILDEETNAIITDTSGTIIHSFHNGLNKERIENKVLSNSTLSTNFQSTKQVLKEMMMPSVKEEGVIEQYIVLRNTIYDKIRLFAERFLYIKVLMQSKQQ